MGLHKVLLGIEVAISFEIVLVKKSELCGVAGNGMCVFATNMVITSMNMEMPLTHQKLME
jgi:hypothetical protein